MSKDCVTYSFGDCSLPLAGGCDTAYVKTGLAPLRVTANTAKLGFNVPRQSVLTAPTATGWSMTVKRGGTNAVVAHYTIAEYNSSKSQAVFFVDDALRRAAKGYYYAEISNDCCVVGRVVLHVDCEVAESVEVMEFTHDPQPVACENVELKSAKCDVAVCPQPKKVELEC